MIAVPATSTDAAERKSAPGSDGFQFRKVSDDSLGLWDGDKPVLVYNHGEMKLPGERNAPARACYVHPIYGLDGEVLTDDFPRDHYHHHGLFWSWPHVRIGDNEYDLWLGNGIGINFVRWLGQEANADGAKLGIENAWMVGDTPVMHEVAWFHVHPASREARCVDVEVTWTPIDKPITLRGAEGKSYGGMTLRFAPNEDTVITTPVGRTPEDLLVTKLAWADYSGRFAGAVAPSGAALFVDPTHADFPPEWMTRHYGVLAVGWPGIKDQALPEGEPFTCRYRLWIHRGTLDAATIGAAYDAYRTGSSP